MSMRNFRKFLLSATATIIFGVTGSAFAEDSAADGGKRITVDLDILWTMVESGTPIEIRP